MVADEYAKALNKALDELSERVMRRDLLNGEIVGLKETVRILSSRVKMPEDKRKEVAQALALADSATPTLTDAVRTLLTRVYPKEMTAVEIRNELEDPSNYEESNVSLSACHAALKRMLSDGEVEQGPSRNGKTTYCRVLNLKPQKPLHLSALAGLNVPELPNLTELMLGEWKKTMTPDAKSNTSSRSQHMSELRHRRHNPFGTVGRKRENPSTSLAKQLEHERSEKK